MSLTGKGSSLVSNTVILLLIAHLQGTASAGVYSLAAKYTTVSLGLAAFGLDSLLIRDLSQNPYKAREYVRIFSLLRTIIAFLLSCCVFLFIRFISDYPPHIVRIVILFILSLIPESLYRLHQSALIALNAHFTLAWVGIVRAGFGLPLGIVMLWLGARIEVVVLLQLSTSCLALLIGRLSLRKQLKNTPCSKKVKRLKWQNIVQTLKNTIPFAVVDGLFTLEWQLDVLLLSFFVNEQQIGIYSVAQAILSVLMIVLYAVDTVVYPLISRLTVQEPSKIRDTYHQLLKTITVSVIPTTVLLALAFSWTIPRFLGEEFVPSLIPLYWLIVTWALHFISIPSARLLISLGWQKLIAAFVTLDVVSNILFSLFLLPAQGIQAPALARTFSATIYTLLCTSAVIWLLNKQRRKNKVKTSNTTKELLLFWHD
jgi:O-antigen/teichoic acid export membrane protein